MEKNLIAATLLLVALVTPAGARPPSTHPQIFLSFGPLPNPQPHPIRDADDAKETARLVWLTENPRSWAMYREKWHAAYSVTHKSPFWILKEPGFTITVDEADGHIVSAAEGE